MVQTKLFYVCWSRQSLTIRLVVGAVVACCSMFITMLETLLCICYWNKEKKQMKWRAALFFLSTSLSSSFCFHFSTVREKNSFPTERPTACVFFLLVCATTSRHRESEKELALAFNPLFIWDELKDGIECVCKSKKWLTKKKVECKRFFSFVCND